MRRCVCTNMDVTATTADDDDDKWVAAAIVHINQTRLHTCTHQLRTLMYIWAKFKYIMHSRSVTKWLVGWPKVMHGMRGLRKLAMVTGICVNWIRGTG